jgi:hypothetical protein
MFEVCELRPAYQTIARTHSPSVTGPYHKTLKDAISACMKLNRTQRPTMAKLAQYLSILATAVNKPEAPPPAYTVRRAPPVKNAYVPSVVPLAVVQPPRPAYPPLLQYQAQPHVAPNYAQEHGKQAAVASGAAAGILCAECTGLCLCCMACSVM